ncbi:MAG: hypothetical protein ACR2OW_06675 [Methyloligellaceae bacterium]
MLDRINENELRSVKYFRAKVDNRVLAIYIKADFDEFEKFPPYIESEEEIQHLKEAYKGTDPETERRTKAHITDDDWPLQVIMLNRQPGGTTTPHYHIPEIPLPDLPTRHQILLGQSGRARVKILTKEGHDHGDVFLEPGDLVLMLEGHEIEFLEPNTRLIEIKQGPFPVTDEADKINIETVIPAE